MTEETTEQVVEDVVVEPGQETDPVATLTADLQITESVLNVIAQLHMKAQSEQCLLSFWRFLMMLIAQNNMAS
jgi:hypothetical protein